MASSSSWSKPGSWALDAEENEAELQEQHSYVDSSPAKLADFPSLATAAATKPKKKKGQTLSLAEFTTYGSAKPTEPTRLTHEDLLVLPTGPRQRSPEELDRNRLGGGFKSYGSNRYNSTGDDVSSDGRWGSRVSNRNSMVSNREMAPSRADEIDNWASAKKSIPSRNGFGGGFERRERGGGVGGFFDSQSKADEVDNWAANKSYKTVNEAPPRRFGLGFDRRSSFDSLQWRDSPRDLDNWRKKEESVSSAGSGGMRPRSRDSPRDFDNWRKKEEESVSSAGSGWMRPKSRDSPRDLDNWRNKERDLDSWRNKEESVSSAGSGGVRPKLVLQPRTVPLTEEGKKEVTLAKPKGANPFGEARPREVVLKEKGKDWKEIDEKLEAVKIKETLAVREIRERGDRGGGKVSFGNVRAPVERSWRKSVETAPDVDANADEHRRFAQSAAI